MKNWEEFQYCMMEIDYILAYNTSSTFLRLFKPTKNAYVLSLELRNMIYDYRVCVIVYCL